MFIRKFALTNLVLFLFAGSVLAQSADTVLVPAYNPDSTFMDNTIIKYVVADTNSSGHQLHSVYKLIRGAWYPITQAINFKNPIVLIADAPDTNKPAARILSDVDSTGATCTGNLIQTWANLTLKNIDLCGIDMGGQNNGWGQGNALFVEDSDVTINMDGVWCEYNGWAAISTTSPHTVWHVNNFHARMEQNGGDQWTTFLFYLETAQECDSLFFTNCSYFQSNSCFLFAPPVVKYMYVSHCTFVNTYKHPFLSSQWLNATFNNNIFYNCGSLGMTKAEAESQDREDLPYGLINVDTLLGNTQAAKDTGATAPMAENQRSIVVKNNLWFFSAPIQAYWTAHDSVVPNPFMNTNTASLFNNKTAWPGLDVENTWNEDPQFTAFPSVYVCDTILAAACRDIRLGSTHGWDWAPDKASNTYYKLDNDYPTPENFRSYDVNRLGTDGKPLGCLTYYPGVSTAIKGGETQTPSTFALKQNYPNPFNPSSSIDYSLPAKGFVTLKVYNILGQEVATLFSGQQTAGIHTAIFNGDKFASGVYFYRLQSGSNSITMKMVLMK